MGSSHSSGPILPPDLTGFSPEQRAQVQDLLVGAMRAQAEGYAFSALKDQVDRLGGVTDRLGGLVDQLLRDGGNLANRLAEHEHLEMHSGTRDFLHELRLDELSKDERDVLFEVLRGQNIQRANKQARMEFWQSWQIRTAVLFGAMGILIAMVSLLLRLVGAK